MHCNHAGEVLEGAVALDSLIATATPVQDEHSAEVGEHRDNTGAAGGVFETDRLVDKAKMLGLLDRVRGQEHLQAKHRDWLIEGILLSGRPFVIGGAEKCLKSNIAVDLAVSLASQTPFLGRFKVRRSARVLYFSAESGEAEIESMLRRMRGLRKIDPFPVPEDDPLAFSYNSVPLGDEQIEELLVMAIQQHQADVLVIDPMYLSLPFGGQKVFNPASLYDVGPRLHHVTTACRKTNSTPIFVHHGKKIGFDVIPTLDDLQFAGFRQYAGQWLLMNRKSKYNSNGKHRLVMVAGGRDGHSGIWDLDVDEGLVRDRLTKWSVTVKPHKQVRKQKALTTQAKAGGQAESTGNNRRASKEAEKVLEAIRKLQSEHKDNWVPRQKVLKATRIKSGSKLTDVIKGLLISKQIVVKGKKPQYLSLPEVYR